MKKEIYETEDVMTCECLHKNAMMWLMGTSGMRVADLCQLDYFDFLSSIADYFQGSSTSPFRINMIYEQIRSRDDIIGTWELYNKKTGAPYVTFSTPKTMHAIMDSLYLRKGSRQIDQNEPLFVGLNGKRITPEEVTANITNFGDQVGLDIKPEHLRELFVDRLTSAGIPNEIIKLFLGHKIIPSTISYVACNRESLISDYKKAFISSAPEEVVLKVPIEQYKYFLDEMRMG